eukprot:CAMPEP_0198149010 /NCGR_PEP_ID=MMETSP1443-20131203/44591_1 /TAXON_ID=186043 /ORGANISM="Entomoneis sp., Strain CCMP2396" /LENGTH=211 /DNA_ID=CAMNT_0043813901 /DNA_START=38 /DNA_END=670 /DNA_ORIENTATION=-
MTMKESLYVMQMLFSASSEKEEQIANYIQQKSKTASTRLSKMSKDTSNKMQMLQLTSVESNDFQSLRAASVSQNVSSLTSYTAILIREPFGLTPDVGTISDRESGVMLYNYSLACFLCSIFSQHSMADTNEVKRDDFYSIAYRSIGLSHKAFSKRLIGCVDVSQDMESVFFATLALQCTSKILRARGENAQALEAENAMMVDLIEAIEEEQ